jgi:hypothetical protein
MPLYFFNYRVNGVLENDPEGTDLPSDDAARKEAEEGARELLANKVRLGNVVDGDEFEVTTTDGTVVFKVPLRSVLQLEHTD